MVLKINRSSVNLTFSALRRSLFYEIFVLHLIYVGTVIIIPDAALE